MTVIAWLLVLLLVSCSQPAVAPKPATPTMPTEESAPKATLAAALPSLPTPTAAATPTPTLFFPLPTAALTPVPPTSSPAATATPVPPTLTSTWGPAVALTPTPPPRLRPQATATPSAATIPIIDAHNHVMPGLTPEEMVSLMDQAGVSKIVLMALKAPQGEARDRLTLSAHERYPDRVIPFLGLNGVATVTPSILDYLDSQLSSGKVRGPSSKPEITLFLRTHRGSWTSCAWPPSTTWS
jgi:hypothetical protein